MVIFPGLVFCKSNVVGFLRLACSCVSVSLQLVVACSFVSVVVFPGLACRFAKVSL